MTNYSHETILLTLPEQEVLLNGVFDATDDAFRFVQFNCPTGNCSFAKPYSTLGLCSDCQDHSEQINTDCHACSRTSSVHEGQNAHQCNALWPAQGVSLRTPCFGGPIASNTSKTLITGTVLNGTYPEAGDHFQQKLGVNLLMSTFEESGCATSKIPIDDQELCFNAVQCNFHACIKTYSGEVVAGKLKETLRSQLIFPRNRTEDISQANIALLVECLSNEEKEWVMQHYQFDDTYRNMPLWNIMDPAGPSFLNVSPDCTYFYDFLTFRALAIDLGLDVIGGVLNGSDNFVSFLGPWTLEHLFNNSRNTFVSINSTMNSIANSWTAYMRATGPSRYLSEPMLGSTFVDATCVSVQWPWFLLPLLVGLLTICFFVLTIRNTARQGRHRNWKSSPLPLLFHGLDPRIRGLFGLAGRMEDMERQSKATRVQLIYTEEGWRFIGQHRMVADSDSE